MLNGFVDNFNSLLAQKLNAWFEAMITMLPNLVLALIVIVGFYYLAKWSNRPMKKVVQRMSDNPAIRDLFTSGVFTAILLLGLFFALSILKLEKAVTSLLAGAGVIGLALGFAFQEIATNFVSGILISLQKPYKIGDIIEIGSYLGEVKRIDLRVTIIRTFDGREVLVPNKTMYTSSLTNYTMTPDLRLEFEVGISYGEDLERVERIAREALHGISEQSDKQVDFFFKQFADSSINFIIHVWVYYPGTNAFWTTHHEVVTKIKKAFDENGITIPFPIRTLDFGIKGGTPLGKALPPPHP